MGFLSGFGKAIGKVAPQSGFAGMFSRPMGMIRKPIGAFGQFGKFGRQVNPFGGGGFLGNFFGRLRGGSSGGGGGTGFGGFIGNEQKPPQVGPGKWPQFGGPR